MFPFTTEQLRQLDGELRSRQFNLLLDQYLTSGTMTAEQYEMCTKTQRVIVQCLKRAFARITSSDDELN